MPINNFYRQEFLNHLIYEMNYDADKVNNASAKELIEMYLDKERIATYEEFIMIVNGAFNIELDKIEL